VATTHTKACSARRRRCATHETVAVRIGLVIATLTGKNDRAPCSRKGRMWRRNVRLAPAECLKRRRRQARRIS
jgi:hypothetical protein